MLIKLDVIQPQEREDRVHTFPRPRSDREVVAHKLATTEQSVSTSCTKSVFPATDMTGFRPVLDCCSVALLLRKISAGLCQPANISRWHSERCKSGLSLISVRWCSHHSIVRYYPTYVKLASLSYVTNSVGAGGWLHGGKTKPLSFAPSRMIISSRVVSFRVDFGGCKPGEVFDRAADCQSVADLIASARVRSSLHFESNCLLSSDGANRRALM